MNALCGSRLQPRHRHGRKTGALAPEITRATSHIPSYVLKTHHFNPCRINTYVAHEATLKTNDFKPFIFRTYEKSPRNAFRMNTYKNTGGGGLPISRHLLVPK